VTRRTRRRPPWPVQLLGTLGAMAGAALAVTAMAHLLIGGAW
jgi:4'-phosphopantetheinyl transferase EntD